MQPNGEEAKFGTPRIPTRMHPFSTPGRRNEASSTISSLDTASLIQSAARSILDSRSPETDMSDTDDERSFCSNDVPALRSLETRTVPALPSEQDRKRFVGCLAAILASAYSFDCRDEHENDSDRSNAEAMLYMDISESSHGEKPRAVYSRGVADFNLPHSSANGSFEYSEVSFHGSVEGDHSGGGTLQRWTGSSRLRISLNRHRRRRYDVLSQLLISSATMLQVELSQAKAFLPMLSSLLAPNPKDESLNKNDNRPFWRNSKVQGLPVDTTSERLDGRTPDDIIISQHIDEIEHLRPFLESLTPGAGFRCLSMFLIQHLLHSGSGYDARIRSAVKKLGVILLINDMEKDHVDMYAQNGATSPRRQRRTRSGADTIASATRKFESLEQLIARKFLLLSRGHVQHSHSFRRSESGNHVIASQSTGLSRFQVMRSLKIGGTAVVAGTLFAVTGGLAAPGIAAGIAALAGGTAVTAAAAAVLTSTAAVTAIFGVGGGSLAAYKMQRRTQGLTEFCFNKESGKDSGERETQVEPELFSTICVSGWLRDKYDFQRPWGVSPTSPPLSDRLELLERFYSVYKPSHVARCAKILEHWKGEENQLWKLLEQKYGRNPGNLFPLVGGQTNHAALTLEQKEVIGQLFVELGCDPRPSSVPTQSTPFERMRRGWKKSTDTTEQKPQARSGSPFQSNGLTGNSASFLDASLEALDIDEFESRTAATSCSLASSGLESASTSTANQSDGTTEDEQDWPKHVATVWDYEANYGGELYTVKWESELLTELCDSVADLAFELVSGGTAQLLKHTALSTLLSAFAWPYALVNAANMIDGTWTLAVERCDEAGKELARSLLYSSAGYRPVTLVGFSFGARTVYSCLKELVRYQDMWEDTRQSGKSQVHGDSTYANMREPASIVEDAILMGLPNHLSLSSWKACRQVVSGRLVNCFSQKDLILSLMFQFKRFGGLKPVCGVCAVNVSGVENFDVTDLISGHQDYCLYTGEILKRVRHGQPFAQPKAVSLVERDDI
jgi:hypothetical protein